MKKILYALFAALILVACGEKEEKVQDTTPRLFSIVPYNYVSGGTAVISGSGFSEIIEEDAVTVDTIQATITAATTDRLTIILPEHENGKVEVKVSVRGIQSPDALSFTYTTMPPDTRPVINGISPSSGRMGTEVTISGENFSSVPAENTVLFGSAKATVNSASAGTLVVTAPSHNPGTVTVSVITGGHSFGFPNGFTYEDNANMSVTSISPSSGKVGDTVRITGVDFIGDPAYNYVKLGLAPAKIVAATSTAIDVIVPDLPGGTYQFTVTSGEYSDTSEDFTLARSWRIETLAGSGAAGLADGAGSSAKLGNLQGAAMAPDSTIRFTQRGGTYAIRSFDPKTKAVTTIAKYVKDSATDFLSYPWGCAFAPNGDFWFCNKGGTASVGCISGGVVSHVTELDEKVQAVGNAMCVQVASDGKVYILCRAATSRIFVWDGGNVGDGFSINGLVEYMMFDRDSTHLILAMNSKTGDSTIRTLKLDDGSVSAPIAGSGQLPTEGTYTDGTPGQPLTATIGLIEGMCFTPDGKLWFSDTTAKTFRCLTPGEGGDLSKGTIETVIGVPFATQHADGLGSKACIRYPAMPVALSGEEIILLDGTDGYRIRRVYLE